MPMPSSRSTTTFCRKITGVSSPWNIFISMSTRILASPSTSFLASDMPPRSAVFRKPVVGHEMHHRADHAVIGHRVGVFVRVGHAGVELEALVAAGVRPDVVADRLDPVVGGAHEGADALVIGRVEHLDDRGGVLELHRLGAGLLLGHVVDAEELVVAEQQPVHGVPLPVPCRAAQAEEPAPPRRRPRRRRRRPPRRGRDLPRSRRRASARWSGRSRRRWRSCWGCAGLPSRRRRRNPRSGRCTPRRAGRSPPAGSARWCISRSSPRGIRAARAPASRR